MAISSSAFGTLNKAISAYTDEEYTRAKKIVGTALVGSDAQIQPNGEDFIGQVRFYKPLGAYAVGATGGSTEDVTGSSNAVVNVASQNEDYGKTTNISTEVQTYIKTVRTHGANEYMVQSVISGEDGLGKIARDFAETRAEDNDQALRAVLNGVRNEELSIANAAAGSTYSSAWMGNDPNGADPTKGFGYVATSSDTINTGGSIEKLVDLTATAPGQRVEHIIRAMGAWSDYAPDFVYMVISPEDYLDVKVANLVDDERVTDGNITFETILGGVIRLIVSRNFGGAMSSAARASLSGVTATTPKVSFMMLPGSLFMHDVSVPNPVAVDRNEHVGMGSGRTTAWYRWGYVMHPRGYTFTGTTTAFATNAELTGTEGTPTWDRKVDPLNLGILPIFHA